MIRLSLGRTLLISAMNRSGRMGLSSDCRTPSARPDRPPWPGLSRPDRTSRRICRPGDRPLPGPGRPGPAWRSATSPPGQFIIDPQAGRGPGPVAQSPGSGWAAGTICWWLPSRYDNPHKRSDPRPGASRAARPARRYCPPRPGRRGVGLGYGPLAADGGGHRTAQEINQSLELVPGPGADHPGPGHDQGGSLPGSAWLPGS